MNTLRILRNDRTDPFENLSVEKNLLELELHGDVVLMLWQNECCVVVGRFQNPDYEVNLDYVHECLRWEETYPEDQHDFVKSKRSQVANLSEYAPNVTLNMVKEAIICEFVHTLAPKDVMFLG